MTISKNQIDKLGHCLRGGEIDAGILRRLDSVRSQYSEAYLKVESVLADRLGYKLAGRPFKSTLAIIEKLKRESSRLSQMQDIAGCRVIAQNITHQDDICRTICVMIGNVSLVDRRVSPINGYRAVHLIARHDGWPVEIQVRTLLQHAWAELSEKIADSYGQEIKYGKGASWALSFLSQLSDLLREIEEIDLKVTAYRREAGLLMAESGKRKRSPRKLIKDLEAARRLRFYKVRELFIDLKDR